MDSNQISTIINILPNVKFNLQGGFKNDTIPHDLQSRRNCFFIVNTSVNETIMGHWVLFCIKDFALIKDFPLAYFQLIKGWLYKYIHFSMFVV